MRRTKQFEATSAHIADVDGIRQQQSLRAALSAFVVGVLIQQREHQTELLQSGAEFSSLLCSSGSGDGGVDGDDHES